MVESSPASLSVFLTSLFMSSAQDSGKTSSSRTHNKCLRVIKTIMLTRTVDGTVRKTGLTFFESGTVRCLKKKTALFFYCKSSLSLLHVSLCCEEGPQSPTPGGWRTTDNRNAHVAKSRNGRRRFLMWDSCLDNNQHIRKLLITNIKYTGEGLVAQYKPWHGTSCWFSSFTN